MNKYISSLNCLRAKELEIYDLKEKMKKVTGIIDISKFQHNQNQKILHQIHQHQIRAEELEIKVSELFIERKAKCEADFSAAPVMGKPHPCSGDCNETRHDNNHY